MKDRRFWGCYSPFFFFSFDLEIKIGSLSLFFPIQRHRIGATSVAASFGCGKRAASFAPTATTGFSRKWALPPPPPDLLRHCRRRPQHVGAAMASRPLRTSEVRFRRNRRGSAGDRRSPFNPVIVLRSPSNGRHVGDAAAITNSFEFYYDDSTGSGLQPLPESISDFLMGSGFDRILEQLAQIETNGIGDERGCERSPASKAAIESMPSIEIVDDHIEKDCHCTICLEPFLLGAETREMPCKHIYHQGCILRWLSLRNSCPVCRLEMPTDASAREATEAVGAATAGNDMETVGLTIWRLPGGGFAVGRFAGETRPGEREFPVVYTEMDGGFNNINGAPRRISWTSRNNRSRESWGISQAFANFFSFFRLSRSNSTSSRRRLETNPVSAVRHYRSSFFRSRLQA